MGLTRWVTIAAIWTLGVLATAVAWAQPAGPDGNLPLPPERLVERLRTEEFQILSAKDAGGGVMGAKKLTLSFPADGSELKVKWKRAPDRTGDGWNNSPRREIGSYDVQRLFLDPGDYIVPPLAARCIPLETYRIVDEEAEASFEGASCVYGVLSAWLQNVTMPKRVYDKSLFKEDPRYAFHMANLNILSYLINHQDARQNNYLWSTNPGDRRVFSIDNGLAFSWTVRNYFRWHWNRIRLPRLPRRSIDRLRRVERSAIEKLGVLDELAADESGIFRHVAPTANADPREGTRVAPGRIQFGLTRKEIDSVDRRRRELLDGVDRGKWELF